VGHTLREWACRYVRVVLQRCDGNKSKASRILGISTHTLTTYLRHAADETDEAETAVAVDAEEPSPAMTVLV
jgi:DNA-binding NtrC family response regulator